MGVCLILILAFEFIDSEQMKAVKEAMHVSTAPPNIVCREGEQKRVLEFCQACVEQEKAGSLYVCGCPGTGKSLSMEKVKQLLFHWANEVQVQPISSISLFWNVNYALICFINVNSDHLRLLLIAIAWYI